MHEIVHEKKYFKEKEMMTLAQKPERNTLARRSKILELLNMQNNITVVALSKMFDVSDVSIRNDLAHLEAKGLLIRTRGGAITRPVNFDLSLNQRLKRNYKQKQKIGKKAVEYISDGDTIVMDSGSTILEVARNLKNFKNLKLVTNSLPITELIADNNEIEVVIPGGILRPEMRSLMGSFAERSLMNFYCDVAFLGVDSIVPGMGIYTPQEYEATLSQTMIKISRKVIVVADSTKFGRKSFVRISEMSDIDVLITDDGIPAQARLQLQNSPMQLIIV